MILSTFADPAKMASFLTAAGLTTSSTTSVEIGLHMTALARYFEATLEQTDFSTCRYIVKVSNPATIATTATVVNTIGTEGHIAVGTENFYVVDSAHGLALYDELNGMVDQADVPVELMAAITATSITDLPADYQWGRLRLISRTRPFVTTWNLAQTNFSKKPNLVIIDSGINFSHTEFQGLDTEDFYALDHFNGDFRDDAGHGTGIASYACGTNIGVHQHLTLLNCKIFSATYKPNALDLSKALDAVYDRFVADPTIPMVVNMSWVVNKNNYLEAKIQNMIDAGIAVVTAAGNKGMDVSLLTPAGMNSIITVGASDQDDVAAGFNNFSIADMGITTNYGLNVDIFAPGVDCIGADYRANNSYFKYSGTSISAGYISGCVAAILALVPNTYYSDAKRILSDYSTKGPLLLDLDKFTFNQNQLAFLITGDSTLSISSDAFYLGYIGENSAEIVGNINQVISVSRYQTTTDESFLYSIVPTDSAMSSILNSCISLTDTGDFTITEPPITWGQDEKLKLIEFRISAVSESSSITFTSPNLIFFATNPDVEVSISGDITTALESIDSQSFFATWYPTHQIK
jgi:subtilisin family serine protease